jgi:hypothetical protein
MLAATLLLFICTESTALASAFQEKTEAASSHQLSIRQHELQVLFSILAEQSEERDERNDFFPPLEREIFQAHHFPLITSKCISHSRETTLNLRSVPIYTSCCSYLI